MQEAFGSIPVPQKPGMVACEASTEEVEEGAGVHGHPLLPK